ncbi:hypothetical protein J1605_007214 [Eschrichtius robustus]|uniref:Uncharacterized protein n=1 Tax=Eschrichtius robustus TaxID=9764 RepID=A0AB34H339_ESCRO|nr:hypothetical protein J1605_007214 [Eschrichtius robustus]
MVFEDIIKLETLNEIILDLEWALNPMTVVRFHICGASLVAQWLRIHLPMQETRVRALVREDPTCPGTAKPMHHNY